MQTKTRAIVISSLKYGDTSLIVKAFTASDGLKSYLLKGVLASRKGRFKAAYFQPLTQLELVANHRNKGSLEHLREVRISYPYKNLHTHGTKRAICIFLSEILSSSIREEEQNQSLYNYLETAFQWLDTHEQVANFHILFLLRLSKYLGFYPDYEALHHPYFDLVEGQFSESQPLSPSLSGKDLDYFRSFLEMDFDGLEGIRLGQKGRNTLMLSLLQYYAIHLQGFRKPRSLDVLTEVFN